MSLRADIAQNATTEREAASERERERARENSNKKAEVVIEVYIETEGESHRGMIHLHRPCSELAMKIPGITTFCTTQTHPSYIICPKCQTRPCKSRAGAGPESCWVVCR